MTDIRWTFNSNTMKKNIYIYTLCSLLAIAAVSCDKQTSDNGAATPTIGKKRETVPEKNTDNVLADFSHSKYLKNFTPADFAAGLSAGTEHPLAEAEARSFNRRYESCSNTSMLPPDAKPFRVRAEGLDIDPVNMATRNSSDSPLKALFGKSSTFQIKGRVPTRDGSSQAESSGEATIYIPELIRITSPEIKSTEQYYPFCYSKDFVLRWNADPNNKNGVLIIVEWHGTTVYQGDYPNTNVRAIDLVEDTGEAKLDERLFEGIPNSALAYLTVLRGDIEDVDIDGCTYKVSGETHAYMPFVLVTKIKTKE